ncbi:hypothetical protein Tco_0129613, partial [Tanacetum coccineum]
SASQVNGVSRSVPKVEANSVVANGVGVSRSVPQVQANGVMANGVSGSVAPGMTNGVSGSVSQVVADGGSSSLGEVASKYVPQVDKDHLLGYFNKEVRKDLARVREYRAIACGLRITVRRRCKRIRRLEALGNCQDAIDTIRFWERMQLDDLEKGTRALLMMNEIEAKIHEKARMYTNVSYSMAELPMCDELRRSCCSKEWEDMFIQYCHRAAIEDSSLASEINGFCAGRTARIEQREHFIDELDGLLDMFVPKKMAKFMKETQDKDRNRLMRLQILGREFELRADEKNHFIEKLKGNVDF